MEHSRKVAYFEKIFFLSAFSSKTHLLAVHMGLLPDEDDDAAGAGKDQAPAQAPKRVYQSIFNW